VAQADSRALLVVVVVYTPVSLVLVGRVVAYTLAFPVWEDWVAVYRPAFLAGMVADRPGPAAGKQASMAVPRVQHMLVVEVYTRVAARMTFRPGAELRADWKLPNRLMRHT